jgi:uncharacterized protein YbjT (DUF2867 family)
MTARQSTGTSPAAPGIRLLILGATGAVGSEVLRLALDHPGVTHVVAPTRRPLPTGHATPGSARLINPVTDFSNAAHACQGHGLDAVVCALGTTIRQAGSQAAFAAVDRDLPVALGREALRLGARSMALNSSLGASATGNFYLRTKHQAENGVRQLGFGSYTIVRPSLIDAERSDVRPGERAGLWASRLLGPVIPRRYRPVSATAIAACLLEAAVQGTVAPLGERIVESEAIGPT